MGKTHLAIGILLLFVFSRFTELLSTNKILGASLLLFASLLPDIDNSRSIVGRKFKSVNWMFKHRSFFHSIFAMILFTVLIQVIFNKQNLSLLFMFGYLSHLVADSLTIEGTKPFYPKKKVIKGKLRVGSFLETVIFLILAGLAIYLIV